LLIARQIDDLRQLSQRVLNDRRPLVEFGEVNVGLCSSPRYPELRGIIRWRSERPKKTI
jgi:hypothetical protein